MQHLSGYRGAASAPALRRFSRIAVSTLFWTALIKAGLVIGAAVSVAAQLIER